MKDLALALFVGMAAGVYSSVFIATPLLAHLKSSENEVVLAEKRERARRRAQADRYASVPAFTDDMPVRAEPAIDLPEDDGPVSEPVAAPPRESEASGRGRVAPSAHGPVRQSGASGRAQPSRQPRSKRGKK
jgi:preprotein translocase subunit SecF